MNILGGGRVYSLEGGSRDDFVRDGHVTEYEEN